MCKNVLTCLFICKLKNRFIFTDIYLLIFTIHYLLSFDANDILNIWPTIFFFKMPNVRPCKYSRPWLEYYPNVPDYAWICLNIPEYAWIFLMRLYLFQNVPIVKPWVLVSTKFIVWRNMSLFLEKTKFDFLRSGWKYLICFSKDLSKI